MPGVPLHHQVVDVLVEAPVDRVWRALRDPAEIRRWHGWQFGGLDAEIDAIYQTGASASEASLTVATGAGRFEIGSRGSRGDHTVVRVFRLEPNEDGTFHGYDTINEGWKTFVEQLRFALERHPGEDRRTVYLSAATGTEDAEPADAFGLIDPPGAVGDRYEQISPAGDLLRGEVWFRSEHQLGLTVDAWGEGLLVMATRRPASGPHGAAAVLTTYGIDEVSFDRLRERWTAVFARFISRTAS